jgi:hypothetical protein
MLSVGGFEKQQGILILVTRLEFSCSLFATFRAQESEESKYWRKLIMKIVVRIIVVTMMLAVASLSHASSFAGPGTPAPQEPQPPIAIA